MSDAVNRLLGTSARVTAPTEYRPYVDSGGRPQPGFFIALVADKRKHGFAYHTLDNWQFEEMGGLEFLTFTHRGKAVIIEGHGLEVMFRNIVRNTIMEIHERDGRPVRDGDPIITSITILEAGAERAGASPALKLAK